MKKVLKYLVKIIIAAIIMSGSYYLGKTYRFLYYYFTMFLAPISFFYIIIQFLKILYELEVVRRIVRKFSPYFLKAANKLKYVWGKFSEAMLEFSKSTAVYKKIEMFHLKNTSKITGYTDEHYFNPSKGSYEEMVVLTKKWKKCENNSQRVRFLYRKYIEKGRKDGKEFLLSDTPNETACRWGITADNKKLVSAYYKARYSEKEEISDEIVEELR